MPSPLVAPESLTPELGWVTLLDVRWELGRTDGPERYLEAHLPGAAFVDLAVDLADPPADPVDDRGRHPLPDPERFGAAMRRLGVSSRRPVVVYDATGGLAAARAWWLLRHHGHPAVRLLDGGFAGWLSSGGPVEAGPVAAAAEGDFLPGPGRMPVVDASGAWELAGRGLLVDARAAERFRGESEPVDPVAGHIPGAVSVPTAANLGPDGRFLDAGALRRRYGLQDADDRPVAAYCGSGVTAAHDILALEVAGVRAALYSGSWSGWTADPARPVATG